MEEVYHWGCALRFKKSTPSPSLSASRLWTRGLSYCPSTVPAVTVSTVMVDDFLYETLSKSPVNVFRVALGMVSLHSNRTMTKMSSKERSVRT